MARRTLLPALAAAVTLVAAACGSGDDGAADTPDAVSTEAPTPSADDGGATEAVGGEDAAAADTTALLRFTAPLVGGGEIDGAALADRPTAFWFWSPT